MEVKALTKKVTTLESENHALSQDLELNRAQVTQYKTMCESQQQAMKDKDELLQQLRELNESLQADIKTLREIQKTAPPKASGRVSYSGTPKNPWIDGSSGEVELEQYRKLFVGGLNYETTETTLKAFYEQYGEVISSVIMTDNDGRSRGFGFVIFTKAEMVDAAQKERPHVIDGRTVDAKRALSKEDTDKPENSVRTQKLFVGGMRKDTEENDLYEYFSRYGNVDKVEMITYKDTGKKRGFAFVFFDDYDPVDKMIMIKHHVICGQRCEVKKAVPRDREEKRSNRFQNHSNSSSGGGGGGSGSGQYYDNMSGGGNDYNNYNMQGRGGGQQQQQQQQQQYQAGGMGMPQMGGNQMGNMGGNQMGGNQTGAMNMPPMGNNQQGYNTPQQQSGTGSGDLPPEAQALWASYMTFMQSQQQGSSGPMRNQNSQANRAAPYNTNLSQPQQQPQQPPPPQQPQQYGAYNTGNSTATT